MNLFRTTLLLLLLLIKALPIFAQDDTINAGTTDTKRASSVPKFANSNKKIPEKADTVNKIAAQMLTQANNDSAYKKFMIQPYLPTAAKPVWMIIDYKQKESKDMFFYLLLSIIAFLAFIRMVFPKFYKALFELFFQTSMRQKQYRDQLQQDYVASFLINILFIISTGLFLTLVALHYSLVPLSFWSIYGYSTLLLTLVYSGKSLFLSFAGWVFDNKSAAQGYIFLVSLMNRIMGIILIPFSVLLALGNESIHGFITVFSLTMVIIMISYRYFVSFGSLRNELKINALHFFLYLCAVEIMPIALIYKLLINYFN
jgi:hypothetical protein